MRFEAITKNQTTIIKGVAILFIMCHNFLHWIEPVKNSENEFYYWPTHFSSFVDSLLSYPAEMINILFSYFGHFGVQIFIFISGYGLAKSFIAKEKKYGVFIMDKLKRLYSLMITGVIFFFFFKILSASQFLSIAEWKSLGLKFLFVNIFIPDEIFACVGPWWFFCLIFQLYLFFPLIYKLVRRFKIKTFLIICLISYIAIYANSLFGYMPQGTLIMQNAAGHFPEFSLGVYLAIKSDSHIELKWYWFVIALVFFVLGNLYKSFFPLTFLSITYIIVCGIQFSRNIKKYIRFIIPVLIQIGKYSMVLFVIHGFLRDPFVKMALETHNAAYTILMLILFLIFVFIVSLAAYQVYKKIENAFDSLPPKKK